MVSCGDMDHVSNILTVAWTGTLCTNPPMAYIAVRPERHSYPLIRESGEFVINLTTKELAHATDYCGVRSGRDHNKWTDCRLTPVPADTVKCPLIAEAPVNIECKVRQVLELGSHHVFVADVTAVHVAEKYMDEKRNLPSGGCPVCWHILTEPTTVSASPSVILDIPSRRRKGNGRKSTKRPTGTYNKKGAKACGNEG